MYDEAEPNVTTINGYPIGKAMIVFYVFEIDAKQSSFL